MFEGYLCLSPGGGRARARLRVGGARPSTEGHAPRTLALPMRWRARETLCLQGFLATRRRAGDRTGDGSRGLDGVGLLVPGGPSPQPYRQVYGRCPRCDQLAGGCCSAGLRGWLLDGRGLDGRGLGLGVEGDGDLSLTRTPSLSASRSPHTPPFAQGGWLRALYGPPGASWGHSLSEVSSILAARQTRRKAICLAYLQSPRRGA